MDKGPWWARIHGVTKSQTRLKRLSSHTYLINRKRENGTRCHVSIYILLLIYSIKLARRKAIKCGNNHSSMIRSSNQTSIKGNLELVQNNDFKYRNVKQRVTLDLLVLDKIGWFFKFNKFRLKSTDLSLNFTSASFYPCGFGQVTMSLCPNIQ